ncbi:MAG: arginine--tRNA ligase [Defluviitaleaceae bacterium]|nr:arginine--tRNA ligase [Defluviitaleaceae bacterium]
MDYKLEVAKLIAKAANLDEREILQAIEIPPESAMGDFAFPCFRLAKAMKQAPPAIAENIRGQIELPEFLDRVVVTGAYLNFFVDRAQYAKNAIGEIASKAGRFGSADIGKGGCVVIDYSAPNVAKPFHIGHLRSTVIGHALYNIFNFLGYRSFSINYLGDWGTQFGKIITAYEHWGNDEEIKAGGISALLKLYVKFHDEAEKDPAFDEEARSWFVKMEQGDKYALKLWKWFFDVSMEEYQKIYSRLDITFDSYDGESFYNDKMMPVVEEMKEKNILVKDDGAMIVDLEEYKMPPCLILRRDGGTLYPTRDIASVMYRKKEYDFVKALYVTGNEQNLHFAQWFKVVELMGYEWAKDQLVHIPFGLINFAQGKLSTRKGNVILMEKFLDDAVSKIREVIEQKNPGLANKEQVAEQVGIGAVIFNDLYNNRIKDIEFSWERMLNFEGETGPYVQYTHARCNSVINKADVNYSDADVSILTGDDEFELIKTLNAFPDKIIDAANKYEPFVVSRHIMHVAQMYNKFYHNNNILRANEDVKKARLLLTKCTKDVIAAGLGLLGIKAPEEM